MKAIKTFILNVGIGLFYATKMGELYRAGGDRPFRSLPAWVIGTMVLGGTSESAPKPYREVYAECVREWRARKSEAQGFITQGEPHVATFEADKFAVAAAAPPFNYVVKINLRLVPFDPTWEDLLQLFHVAPGTTVVNIQTLNGSKRETHVVLNVPLGAAAPWSEHVAVTIEERAEPVGLVCRQSTGEKHEQ